MINTLPFLVFLAGCLIVQHSLYSLFPAASMVIPHLTLVAAVATGIFYPSPWGALLSFALGVLHDAALGTLLGPWAGAYVVVFVVAASIARALQIEGALTRFVVVFISSVSGALISLLLRAAVQSVPSEFLTTFVVQGITTALAGAFLLSLLYSSRKRRRA